MNLDVRSAVIAKFESKRMDGNIVHYIIDEATIQNIMCYYDEVNNLLIDINSGKDYYVLNRNERGKIDTSEYNKIKLNENYVLSVDNVYWPKYTYSQKMNILLNYYKLLLSIKFSIIDYSEKSKEWEKRENWKNNQSDENKSNGKVMNLTNYHKKN
jgi:hypothetical protein